MPDTTVIIPCAPYHMDIVDHALASVQAQSTPATILLMTDHYEEGVAVMRNRGVLKATTPYVVFLDADDTIDPKFVELCESIMRPGHYIYTDWYEGETVRNAPAPSEAWLNSTYHVVTTLLHRQDVLDLGGFDETLPGAEDTDFYIRLRLYGVRGLHIQSPLFRYERGGARSRAFVHGDEYRKTMDYFNARYGYWNKIYREAPQRVYGEQQPDDILAMALWQGNRREFGRATGRNYTRCGNFKRMWVHPDDVNASPTLWKPIDVDSVKLMPQGDTAITRPEPEYPVYSLQEAGELLFGVPKREESPKVQYHTGAGLPATSENRNLMQWVIETGQEALGV